MKNKRLLVVAVLLIAVMALSAVCFTACRDDKKTEDGSCTIVLAITDTPVEYKVDVSKTDGTFFSALKLLSDEKKLTFEYTGTGKDAYITKVNDFVSGTDGKWVYLYTSIEKDFDVSEYKSTVTYKGQTLTSSGVGASLMTVEDKAIIYIGLYSY